MLLELFHITLLLISFFLFLLLSSLHLKPFALLFEWLRIRELKLFWLSEFNVDLHYDLLVNLDFIVLYLLFVFDVLGWNEHPYIFYISLYYYLRYILSFLFYCHYYWRSAKSLFYKYSFFSLYSSTMIFSYSLSNFMLRICLSNDIIYFWIFSFFSWNFMD